ncbi:MAG: phosphoglucosamine mutase [candidate division Zixibacteria bacterium]|nr:phosphoglucosamine mutase [candidate division Zixibacteria bacterium]
MSSKNLMISVSGIRGIIGKKDGLTPETALKFAAAYATFCKKGKIVIGSDTRPSRSVVKPAIIAGLTGCGLDVIDLGICPTPTVELAVKELRASGGIIVTASHNPIEWNALKMLNSKGMFLSAEEGNKVLKIYESGKYNYQPHNNLGSISSKEFVSKHIVRILNLPAVKTGLIKERKFKVALDCVNGAGSILSPILIKNLGCELFPINCEPTGEFTRGPEPIPDNLRQLSAAVKKYDCDIGFAHDPDADRLAIVNEKGKAIGEEYTLAFAVDYILSVKKGVVAINLSTSRINDDIAKSYGVKLHRTKVGEINCSMKLKSCRGVIGGEGNGGVIYPELLYGRDGAVGIALILSYLAKRNLTVSQAVSNLPSYVMIKTKVNATREGIEKKLPKLRKGFPKASINLDDGIKFDYEDSWVHIRASNTEPIARIIAEAPTTEKAKQLITKAKNSILK